MSGNLWGLLNSQSNQICSCRVFVVFLEKEKKKKEKKKTPTLKVQNSKFKKNHSNSMLADLLN